ncbi:MAG: HAD-IIB family hydrolase [Bdellovibrionales bacterium]|nr:HAD-IIB family hydrolase [Bdellovibrionales bacterium]
MDNFKELKAPIQTLFTDIDDTLTTHGKLPAVAYEKLWQLYRSGIQVIPVTGRPAGWCEMIARLWPVRAVIGENGAFYFQYKNNKMQRVFAIDEDQRKRNQEQLKQIEKEIFAKVPRAGLASDQFTRLFDLAIDFCEDVPELKTDEIQQIVDIFKSHGAQAKVSSIHVNGWFGDYDKLSMCKNFYQTEFGEDLSQGLNRAAFIGDSPNDEPMFAFFENSVAVGNIQKFLPQLEYKPRYLVPKEGGEGFAAFADHLLDN